MSDITIVCCYNNQGVYNNLVNSLKTQTCNYELIGIDNTGNKKFSSCAGAYNSVLNEIRTKYVIFSHQDILLNEPDSLAKFLEYLDKIGENDILGVAGMKFDDTRMYSEIKHIINGNLIQAGENIISGIMQCDTLDECFFGGYSEHFRANHFDEKISNWHLYAVDSCLYAKSKYAAKIWVCSSNINHMSTGRADLKFYFGFYRLCRKYKNLFPFIRTTISYSGTNFRDSFRLLSHVIIAEPLKRLGIFEFVRGILRKS